MMPAPDAVELPQDTPPMPSANPTQLSVTIALDDELRRVLYTTLARITTMAESMQSLKQKLDENASALDALQNTVDTLQAAAADSFVALQSTVEDLRVRLSNGATISQQDMDALAVQISDQHAKIVSIADDVASTQIPAQTPDAPVVPAEG